ncbi:MAG: sialate O-acetylesterase [Reichenbachiella sp.]
MKNQYVLGQIVILSTILSLGSCTSNNDANISLPKLVSNGMVIQRNSAVNIWGWSDPNQKIDLEFNDESYETTSDKNGNWLIKLNHLSAGGPYDLSINDSIWVRDILVGDVWLCSGQSNMELNMKRISPAYPDDILNVENKKIRYFHVPRVYDFKTERQDLEGGQWVSTSSESIQNFGAVAYYFGKTLYDKYNVPIGLINAALGGSPVESWISEDAIRSFPIHFEEAQRFKSDSLIKTIQLNDEERRNIWYQTSSNKDQGNQNQKWSEPSLDDSDWKEIDVPGYWGDNDLGGLNGVVWYRKDITLSSKNMQDPATLVLGRIIDADSTFVNGQFVGNVTYQYPPRRYLIPDSLLKKGNNNITVRVINNRGRGGFLLDKNYELIFKNEILDLSGKWKYRLGVEMNPLERQTFIRWKPVGLFNGMISPLLNYNIKGAIWYQGESNASRAEEYDELFPAMIQNWREKWGIGDFPFLYVQLANYMKRMDNPNESNWARLRESQSKALSMTNTAMAVAIDLGEWNDIHPLNKKDVGKRLALSAQKLAYNEDVIFSGPTYKSMEVRGNQIILSFDNIGSGMVIKEEQASLNEFAIAGTDKKYVWGNAKIVNDQVIVWNENIKNPLAVRYAWADNPDKANLYNKEGLPASPFRTDNW